MIKRYEIGCDCGSDSGGGDSGSWEDPNGEWVKYEDIKHLTKAYAKLKEVLEWLDNAEYDPGIPGADGGMAYMCEHNGLSGYELIEQIKNLIKEEDGKEN